jgi:hypothetical protein
MTYQYLKFGHNRFLPHLFQFIIHCHPLILTYIVKAAHSIDKYVGK